MTTTDVIKNAPQILKRSHRRMSPTIAANAVAKWNFSFKPGQKVALVKDFGEVVEAHAESEAWLMGGHTAVILVNGISGGYLLSRVVAVQD